VIRLKLDQYSNETYLDVDSKKRYVKIKTAKFANKKCFSIEKTQIKGKIYKKASCMIEYDDITFEKQRYTVVRILTKIQKRSNDI